MPFWRVLNSIALINGESVSEVLIKQIYNTLPELAKIFSTFSDMVVEMFRFIIFNIPGVSIDKAKLMGNREVSVEFRTANQHLKR